MQTGLLQKENSASSFRPAVGQLLRKCACGHSLGGGECAQCGKKQTLHRHSARTARQTTPREAPPIVRETLRSAGQPLDESTRGFMESRFSHNFSHVRVHTDERAAESTRAVNALAYTVGRDVVIPSEHFQPGSSTGRRLLAHELTHVVQQAGDSAATPSTLEISHPDDAAEKEASQIASSVHDPQTNNRTIKGAVRLARQTAGGTTTTSVPAAPTSQEMMDEGNAIRMRFLRNAIYRARMVEIACDSRATPQLMVEAIPREVRPFVSWLGTLPSDSSFCPLVRWARALMVENMNMTEPPYLFAGRGDAFCNYGNQWPYAKYEQTRIKICPKTVGPAQTNSVARALILTHELFHAPLFQMDHPTPEVMNSAHCGSMGSFEAITNPYCMTNVIDTWAEGIEL